MKPWQLLLLGVLFGLLAAGLVLLVAAPSAQTSVAIIPPTPISSITVDVDGAVANPGVYTLSVEARITDAIQSAGGLTSGADTTSVNLAARIRDGEKIFIPKLAAANLQEEKSSSTAPFINLNTATVEQLDQLPGIGLQKANAIVSYRNAYGSFQTLNDLLYVPGIGQSILDTIDDYVTVNP